MKLGFKLSSVALTNYFWYCSKYKYFKTKNNKNCKNMYKQPKFVLDFSAEKFTLGKTL